MEDSHDFVDKTVCERAWYMFPYACFAAFKANDRTCPIHPDFDKELKHVPAEHQTKLITMGTALFKGGPFTREEFPVKVASDRVLEYIVSLIPKKK